MDEDRAPAALSDRELVRLAADSTSSPARREALQAIYDRHSGGVLRLCSWLLGDPDATLDAAQATFEAAITVLTGAGRGDTALRNPDKLGAWLAGIARNQCRAEWRRRRRQGEFAAEDLEDAEPEIQASRRRQAEVDRMLDVVAASLTERQQTIFRLAYRQGIRGQALAASTGLSGKDANDATHEVRNLAFAGFGAYVLARDGRAYCPGLARILNQAAWDGQDFTRVLRLRILRHLDTCDICDDCATCNAQKKNLIKAYAPVLIPILIAAELRSRIYNFIQRVCTPGAPGNGDAQRPDSAAMGLGADAVLTAAVFRTPEPRDTRRRPRRRLRRLPAAWGALVVIAVVAVIAGVLVLPRAFTGSGQAGAPGGQALPAHLDSVQKSLVWKLTSWARPGGSRFGSLTEWRFLGGCAQAATCTYTLDVVKFTLGHTAGPDVYYWPIGGTPSTHVLRLHPAPGGFEGTDSFPTVCNGFANGPPMTLLNRVRIKITGSAKINGRLQANKMTITWTAGISYAPAADRAVCTDLGTFTDTANATLTTA